VEANIGPLTSIRSQPVAETRNDAPSTDVTVTIGADTPTLHVGLGATTGST
jgi:hypothetical protein